VARVVLDGVEKRFGRTVAVHPLDLEVKDGEFLTILGPSGCGKSTVLLLVSGLESPTAGSVRIADRDVTALEAHERDVAMVFQSYALYPHKTVRENIDFPLKIRHVDREERDRRVREVAATLGIDKLLDRRPRELSGGERQRVALGRALVRKPQVFLLDEPLSNLDAQLRTEMRAELKRLHAEFETTFVYVTHDQVEAMTLSERIAVLKDGELQQLGPPTEIYERPANTFVGRFVGNPGMSFVGAELRGRRLALPGMELSVPDGGLEAKRVLLGVRPEHIEVAKGDTEGTIFTVEPLGSETLVVFDWAGARLTARADASFRGGAGDALRFRFEPARVQLFDAESEKRLPVGPR